MPLGRGARRAVLVSTVSVLAGSGVALAGSLAVRVVMARALVPGELGLVLLAIAIVTPAGAIASLGTNPAVAQRVAERRARGDEAGARAIARHGLLLASGAGVATALLLAVAAFPLARLLGQPGLERALLPAAPVAAGLAVGLASLGAARGFGDSVGRAAIRDGGGGLLRVAGVAVAFLGGYRSPLGVAAGFAAGTLAAELSFVVYVASKGWFRASRSSPGERLLPALRPFAAGEALSQATLWLDVVLLGALAPAHVVGLYGVARGLTRVLDLVRGAASHGYLPAASAAVAAGDEARLPVLHVASRMLAFALVWPVLSVAILSPAPLVGLLFGKPYLDAAPALRLLAIASFVPSLFDYLDQILVAERRQVEALRASFAGVATLLLLLVLLAPPLGAEGTALALLGGGLVRGFLVQRRVFRARSFRPFLPAVTRPALLAAGSLAAGALLLALLRPGPLLSILVAASTGLAASAVAFRSFVRGREPELRETPAGAPDAARPGP